MNSEKLMKIVQAVNGSKVAEEFRECVKEMSAGYSEKELK